MGWKLVPFPAIMTAEIIQECLTLLTLLGVIVATIGVLVSSSNAKKRATIDVIMQQSLNKELQVAIKWVNDMAKKKEPLGKYFLSDSHQIEKEYILSVLNAREFVCVGIKCRAFSEKIYKRASYSTFIRDWDNLNSIVAEIRRETKKLLTSLNLKTSWRNGNVVH